MPRLVLINPRGRTTFTIADTGFVYPPLGLAMVAAVTPPGWEVQIVDETLDEDGAGHNADLVGFTAYTTSAPRAYELAESYRARGIPTVMGGVHASAMPEEAKDYVDCVVTGEVEEIWPRVLADFEAGRLMPRYDGGIVDMLNVPKPRHDLLTGRYRQPGWPGYTLASVQTTRGCPYDCEFCSVTRFNGKKVRERSVASVLDELESIDARMVFLVDDVLVDGSQKSRKRAKELFEGMIKRGIKKIWFCQSTLNFAKDEALLDLAAKAGCRSVLIGVEAEAEDALGLLNKKLNLHMGVDSYEDVFARINARGISVLGAFVMGTDADTIEALRRRAEYISTSNANTIQLSVLTPLPGTRLFERLRAEGRLIHDNFPADWARYDFMTVNYRPKHMTAEAFEREFARAVDQVYAWRTSLRKMGRVLGQSRDPWHVVFTGSVNATYREAYAGRLAQLGYRLGNRTRNKAAKPARLLRQVVDALMALVP